MLSYFLVSFKFFIYYVAAQQSCQRADSNKERSDLWIVGVVLVAICLALLIFAIILRWWDDCVAMWTTKKEKLEKKSSDSSKNVTKLVGVQKRLNTSPETSSKSPETETKI